MSSEVFQGRSVYRRLVVTNMVLGTIAVGAGALTFLVYPSWFTGCLLILMAVAFASTVRAWRNRSRPMLEITDEEIRYGPWEWWFQPRRVALRDIESIEFSDERRAVIRRRSGGRLVVRLRCIEAASRGPAVAALKRVARTTGPMLLAQRQGDVRA